MAQLRSCYFCGAVGDSLREYELLPERVVPAGESPTAVLCSTCHEKLRRVLEPLVETAPASDSAAGAGGGDPSLQEVTFESADRTEAAGGGEAIRESGIGSARPDASADAATGAESSVDEADTAAAPDEAGEDSTDEVDVVEASTDAGEEPTDEVDVVGASTETRDDAESTAEATTEADAETGPTDEAATADGSSSDEGEGTAAASEVPDAYYKVLRLLQNREFPMERADLVGLVTGAYDVSEPECERILETAVERGVLVEDGSTVRLGRN